FDDLTAEVHPEQAPAQFRLRSVHAHVQRRKSLVDQSAESVRTQVGESYITAVCERQPEIVILQPQRWTCLCRIAVDEAEYALVRALPHRIGGRYNAERLACFLFDLVDDAL